MLRGNFNYEAVGKVVGRSWGHESIGIFKAKRLDDENKMSVPSKHSQGSDSNEPTLENGIKLFPDTSIILKAISTRCNEVGQQTPSQNVRKDENFSYQSMPSSEVV